MPVKLSILTINLNNASGLTKTIESVFQQSYTDFEYIVIDGGSTDGSVQLLETYSEQITFWVSEPDRGIYHAMNKGVLKASGDYCLFLNSGDWLSHPTILNDVFTQKPQADVIAGDVYFFDTKLNAVKWHVPSPSQFTAKALFSGTLPHQATFIRRSLFTTIGLYNEHLRIASDWLFFMEALLEHGCTYQHFPGVVAYFNMDGISCDPATNSLPRLEQLDVLQQKYPRFLPDYERLERLEMQTQQWFDSREYRVYRFLDGMGIIRLGVLARKLKRAGIRTLFRKDQ